MVEKSLISLRSSYIFVFGKRLIVHLVTSRLSIQPAFKDIPDRTVTVRLKICSTADRTDESGMPILFCKMKYAGACLVCLFRMSGQFQYLGDVCGNFGTYSRSLVNKALTAPFSHILVGRTHVFLEGTVT
jgi:hypothetical protein